MISYALDAEGIPTFASTAITGMDYFCPQCGVKMRCRKCSNRSDHFYLMGEHHRSADCAAMERDKHITRDIKLLEPERLKRRLMRPRSSVTQHNGGQHGSPSQIDRVLAPSSLKQLSVCGLASFPPNTPIEGGVLSDVFLPITCYREYLPNISSHDLGFRILILKPDHIRNDCIIFVAFWRTARMFFSIRFDDPENLAKYANDLFVVQENQHGGFYGVKPKVSAVWVAGIWSNVPRNACEKSCIRCVNAKTPCVGMQEAAFSSNAQIYIPN